MGLEIERKFLVEGDFSGAAFPLSLGAIGPDPVTVTGLSPATKQGDAAILSLLRAFGATVTQSETDVTVSPAPLHGITVDVADIPDLLPVLAVLGAAAQGTTRLTNAARLRLKESDRLLATATLIQALGGTVTEGEDFLTVTGGTPLTGGTVEVFGDHRIAMSAALLSLLATGPVTIENAAVVAKSYPTFFDEVFPGNQNASQE